MPKNAYAKTITANRRRERELIQWWCFQFALDCMSIVLNDPEVMGHDVFGKERLEKLAVAYNARFKEFFTGMTGDVAASYVRAKMDERLRRIYGDNFEDWEHRYYLWDDRGI